MPQLVFKGVSENDMQKLSTPLIEKIATAIGCDEDWLIIERCPSVFYGKGEKVSLFPIVEVLWYERPQLAQEAVANIVKDELFAMGYSTVQVIFTVLMPDKFYEFDKTE